MPSAVRANSIHVPAKTAKSPRVAVCLAAAALAIKSIPDKKTNADAPPTPPPSELDLDSQCLWSLDSHTFFELDSWPEVVSAEQQISSDVASTDQQVTAEGDLDTLHNGLTAEGEDVWSFEPNYMVPLSFDVDFMDTVNTQAIPALHNDDTPDAPAEHDEFEAWTVDSDDGEEVGAANGQDSPPTPDHSPATALAADLVPQCELSIHSEWLLDDGLVSSPFTALAAFDSSYDLAIAECQTLEDEEALQRLAVEDCEVQEVSQQQQLDAERESIQVYKMIQPGSEVRPHPDSASLSLANPSLDYPTPASSSDRFSVEPDGTISGISLHDISPSLASSPPPDGLEMHVRLPTPPVTEIVSEVEEEFVKSFICRAGSQRGPTSSWICTFPDCNKTFTRRYNCETHTRTHIDVRRFACTVKCPRSGMQCEAKFARSHDMRRHIVSVHGEGAKPWLCRCTECLVEIASENANKRKNKDTDDEEVEGGPMRKKGRPKGRKNKGAVVA
ncbi:hypothetical protein M427DRAFT_146024 [Gonapodya prolifera JEL478]|uniref:C2H2-type domain-containing protein n=1 Tax=Gonapodya prolifera (strain JEL478) TaxID=1344416 RepID=A0A139AC88_GONPJ|nr:hypothetical protein M427DRAFT_146024 [Gonapodya prolifera JEL478]|eukprot:KXS14421.1 hypothetical protein M427DRAFT_146024 [Gonapodya prolifera JEL478]